MKIYKQSPKIPPCRLNLKDLQDLISLTEKDIDKSRLRVSATLKGLEINEENLKDFLSNKDLPLVLSSLTLSVRNHWESKINRSIYISFSERSVFSTIEGEDEAWVLGKRKQLEDFFAGKTALFGFVHKGVVIWVMFLAFGVIPQILLRFTPPSITFYSIKIVSLITFFSILWLVFLFYLISVQINPKKFYPYAKVNLETKSTESGWNLTNKISLGQLIIGVIGIVATVVIFLLNMHFGSKTP